jgi:hypothetical protein
MLIVELVDNAHWTNVTNLYIFNIKNKTKDGFIKFESIILFWYVD